MPDQKKPNILIIWGDDIGTANLSCYTHGLMEDPDYPKDPKFKEQFGPCGVLHCWATDKDDSTEQPRWGRIGRQKIEDTGPLTRAASFTLDQALEKMAESFNSGN